MDFFDYLVFIVLLIPMLAASLLYELRSKFFPWLYPNSLPDNNFIHRFYHHAKDWMDRQTMKHQRCPICSSIKIEVTGMHETREYKSVQLRCRECGEEFKDIIKFDEPLEDEQPE